MEVPEGAASELNELTCRAQDLAATIVAAHSEAVTESHMHWLSRECAKLLTREFRVAAREEEVSRREREIALAATSAPSARRPRGKYMRTGNTSRRVAADAER